ncbi:helix-turn-helix domain-containing protein [Streptomyces phaeochromogenes]|uniref:helix-turn-helix domain-containing protein n=1 Tax=Streptomyces phaeochromogenes TaxID=1923 RepID=UPI003722C7A4
MSQAWSAAFAEAGLSLVNAAEALMIHPNTVAYRLGRWHKLTGSDPRTFTGLVRSVVGITV